MFKHKNTKRSARAKLTLAIIAAAGSVAWASFQYLQTRPGTMQGQLVGGQRARTSHPSSLIKTDDGRHLLWANGPRDAVTGEWFDITDSPLDRDGYQYGIGKDSIPAIDRPAFVAIDERKQLHEHGIGDDTMVIGYVHNRSAKAYPIGIMNRHELVNDEVGGKPVTVGW